MVWSSVKLGDVCQIDKEQFRNGQLPYVGMEDIEGHTGRFLGELEPKSVASSTFKFTEEHVLYGRLRPYLNKVLVPEFEGHCSSEIFPLRPSGKLDRKFLYYWLSSERVVAAIDATCTGARMPRANVKEVLNFDFCLPSISEQKSIVAILDQAFADIDKARALTEQNLKNARELFEGYLQQVFSQRGEGWVEKTLGDAVVVERGSSPRPIKKFQTDSGDGVNWVKIGDAKEGQKYIHKTKEQITKEGATKSRFVDVGDFILSNSMSFGRPYIMAIQGYIHDGWFVLRLPECIDPDYFYYLLLSPFLKDQFHRLAAGAIVKNISGDLVKKAILPIPPIGKQKEIASKLDVLSHEIEKLEGLYNQKAHQIEELKKSLLQKAFSGELTRDSEEVAA